MAVKALTVATEVARILALVTVADQ